jgi:hypothetical protein
MAFGVLGCMATLIVEAALVAEFVPSNNQDALQAAVAMFFVFQVFYGEEISRSPYWVLIRLQRCVSMALNSPTSARSSPHICVRRVYAWVSP